MSWSDDKELSLGADVIGWNSLKKKETHLCACNVACNPYIKYNIYLFFIFVLKKYGSPCKVYWSIIFCYGFPNWTEGQYYISKIDY